MANTTTTILFEMASQMKFRYPYKGLITTEDLWDLTPAQLDTGYRNLSKEFKDVDEDSLLAIKTAEEGAKAIELKNKIDVVKYIFNHKQQEAEFHRRAAENAQKRQRLLDALAAKQDDALHNMSEDELLAALAELG